MKIKTSELQGKALSYLVCMIEHPELEWNKTIGIHAYSNQIIVPSLKEPNCYSPYLSWEMCGPIIERESINWYRNNKRGFPSDANRWSAHITLNHDEEPILRVQYHGRGATQLIAAMRCYVASKLGEEVEVPNELA